MQLTSRKLNYKDLKYQILLPQGSVNNNTIHQRAFILKFPVFLWFIFPPKNVSVEP